MQVVAILTVVAPAMPVAEAGFSIRPGFSMGSGEMYGEDTCQLTESGGPCRALPDAQILDEGIQESYVAPTLTRHFTLNPGYRWGSYEVGLWLEFFLLTNSDRVAHNDHLEGEAYLLGPSFAYNFRNILSFNAAAVGFGRYNSDFYQYDTTYGFRLTAGYFIFPKMTVDVGYQQYWFGREGIAGTPLSWSTLVIGVTGHL